MHFQIDNNQSISIKQIIDRKLIIISGMLSFFLITIPLDVARKGVELPEWKLTIESSLFSLIIFFLFLIYGIFWIVGSLVGLRVLAQNERLQAQMAKQWVFQQPLLVQIIVFVEHGIMGALFILLTGDAKRGTILGFLVVIHVLVALIFAPMMVRSPD